MDPSFTGFYRVSQKVSDVIPVLRLTPIATQPPAVSVSLSVAKCGRICRAQTCAHSGVEPYVKIGQGDSTEWVKKFEKNSNFSPFRDFTSIYLRND